MSDLSILSITETADKIAKRSEVNVEEELVVDRNIILPKPEVFRNEFETACTKLRDKSIVNHEHCDHSSGFVLPLAHRLVFIGIDASINNVGVSVAVYTDDLEELVELDNILIKPSDNNDILVAKSVDVYAQITELLNKYSYAKDDYAYTIYVGIEASAFAGNGKVVDLSYLNGAIIHYANTLPNVILVRPFSPSSVKKYATGNGKADKGMMFNHLPATVKKDVSNHKKYDDIVDAYWIMRMIKSYVVAYLPIDRMKPEACKPVFDKLARSFPTAKEFKKNKDKFPINTLLDIAHTFKESLYDYKYSAKEKLRKSRLKRATP